jgi:hypothetical protein
MATNEYRSKLLFKGASSGIVLGNDGLEPEVDRPHRLIIQLEPSPDKGKVKVVFTSADPLLVAGIAEAFRDEGTNNLKPVVTPEQDRTGGHKEFASATLNISPGDIKYALAVLSKVNHVDGDRQRLVPESVVDAAVMRAGEIAQQLL